MACQEHFTFLAELLERIASEGLEFLPELIEVLINTAM